MAMNNHSKKQDLLFNPVLGAICGDIIGSPYEFNKELCRTIEKGTPLFIPSSKFTDDTVLTLAVAKWILNSVSEPRRKDLVKIFSECVHEFPNIGYGQMFFNWAANGCTEPYNSFGNGSAMRTSPIPCAFDNLETMVRMAEKAASVTHNHEEGIKGAVFTSHVIWLARHSDGFFDTNIFENKHILLEVLKKYGYNLNRTTKQIIDEGYKFDATCQGSVPEAFCAFIEAESYNEAVSNAVSLNGDTDTQAAIAGSMAAARFGIPLHIADEARNRLPKELLEIAEGFSTVFNLDW